MLLRLFQLLSLLPLPVLHVLGAVAGWGVYACSPSYRRRLRENLAHAGYPHLLSSAVVEAGKNIFELPFIWCASPARVLRSAELHDWSVAQSALDAGNSVIFLTPHFGVF